jgi:RHS repeat-associated protein
LTALTTPETHDIFSYDAIGNLLEKVTPSETLTYTYDSLYQLTSEPGHTYKYDSHYNRTAKDGKRYTLNSLNQILKQDTSQYTYSANGALTKKVQDSESTTYHYDGLDRLVKVDQWDSTTTYHYDAFNRRISKTHNEITTNYLYQDQNEIGAYVNNDLKELRVLGLGQGAEIGAAVFLELSGQTYVPAHDQNGNVTALFIPSGECLETYRYTAFGEELSSTNIGNPWRFSSKRHDPETGFLYFGQRYYAADLGRWITPDPLEFEDGPNLYAYVHNNPLTSIDLYGLFDDDSGYSFSNLKNDCISGCQRSLQDFCDGFQYGSTFNVPKMCYEKEDLSGKNSYSYMFGQLWGTEFAALGHIDKGVNDIYDHFRNPNNELTRCELPSPRGIAKDIRLAVKEAAPVLEKVVVYGSRLLGMNGKVTQTVKNTTPCLNQLSKAGEAMDRGGLTKAGRALEKHGGRIDSVFPKATGNIANKNMQGQFHLDDILTHPQKKITQWQHRTFGNIIDVEVPGRGGARFSQQGNFIGFLEP